MEAGKKIGWTDQMVDEHWEMMRRGKCFDFSVENGISCTLWEDNIFFRFFSADHQDVCVPVIESLARQLGCSIMVQ